MPDTTKRRLYLLKKSRAISEADIETYTDEIENLNRYISTCRREIIELDAEIAVTEQAGKAEATHGR